MAYGWNSGKRQAWFVVHEAYSGNVCVVAITAGDFTVWAAASLMFIAEDEGQPNTFSSIPAAMWWAVAPLTTVGYGDVYPVKMFGNVMPSIVGVPGIGMVALPTGVLGSGFVAQTEQRDKEANKWPHRGEQVHKGWWKEKPGLPLETISQQ